MNQHRKGTAQPNSTIAAVARKALPHLPGLCRELLPGGRLIGVEWTCGNLAGGPGRSCKVNQRTGRWADFATGESGGDAVSLVAAIYKLSQHQAADRLVKMLCLRV